MRILYTTLCLLSLLHLYSSCNKHNFYTSKREEITLSGDRLKASTIKLSRDTIYLLTESLSLASGQELNIDAGTLIKINSGIRITVNPGAKLLARGTSESPIIFTAAALKGTGGAISQVGVTPNTQWSGITVNGAPGVNSGVLSYVRIEFTGNNNNSAALSLFNVDSTTELKNIQISYAQPLACILSGGNASVSNLISYACYKTDFTFQNSYTGKLQNIIAYRSPFFPDINTFYTSNEALLITGSGTFPTISNLTVIGPDRQPLRSDAPYLNETSSAILISNNASFRLRNSVFAGYPKNGIYINSRESGLALQNGPSELTFCIAHCNDSSRTFFVPTGLVPGVPTVNAAAFKRFMLEPRFNNELITSTDVLNYSNVYDYWGKPNPQPLPSSPLLSGADFSGTQYGNSFFTKVTYRGAIGQVNWLLDWTNFNPLAEDYNN